MIAGIVFLAVELQRNNSLLEAQTRSVRLGLQVGFVDQMHVPEVAELITKAKSNESLTPEDEHRLYWLAVRVMVAWQAVWNESRVGTIPEDAIPVEIWRRTVREQVPRFRVMWETEKIGRDPDFVLWMDQNVVN